MTRTMSRLPQTGDWTSRAELIAMQDEQLPEMLNWAARAPFYAARFSGRVPASRTDFEALPLTSKADLRDSYPFGMLAVERDRLATYHESSGTAGRPTPSYYTEEDWVDLVERYARKRVPIGADDLFLVRTPYALMITGHLAQAAARYRGATVVPGDNRSLAMPFSRVIRVLHDLGVTLTWSMATETLLWAAAAKAAGHDPGRDFPALRALFVGGDPLSAAKRRRISEIWNVPVVEEYGSTETGSLAGECSAGRLHLWADRAIFEVYDPGTGTVRPDGAGQLVVSPLYREAMPLVRYNLEDDVEVSHAPCPCGWHLPTVRVLGRSAFGYPVAGSTVTQHRLEELVFGLPAEYEVLFWRARADVADLRVEIEVPPRWAAGACAELTAAIRREYAVPCTVTAVPPGTLVPARALTAVHDVVKPRSLFGADEDWSKALLYQ
ncbi:phenylacetate--CoA ligase family protein [Plantactinospora sp. S1510]|uniref:Phenylacetate--CoA ligase family protein n=1 Tax=Plantactinospora alkalitolerans TaxID=2789879 RepID=A0ABS0H7K5_9ACTN|nr:AMP-binding protein [Plantactinospora alkalitolerans]MBF9134462.1 phenylacetate--CoA ligase family protein [Plantactinospora alkalitolerans]